MQGKVTTKNAYRLPVALEELELSGGSATPEALENLRDLMEAIRQDLAFSGYFKVVRFDSLYLQLMGQSRMDRKAWSHLGAEYIGSGRVTPSGDGYRLFLKLEGTTTGEVIFEKTFTGLWERSRQTAHQVAGEIIYYLWGGRTLIFETQIIACWESGKAKNLYLLDYDGYRPRAVTNYGDINISPCWFPSGDRVVFTSYRDGNPDLWLVLLKNNSTQKISGRPGLNTAPTGLARWPLHRGYALHRRQCGAVPVVGVGQDRAPSHESPGHRIGALGVARRSPDRLHVRPPRVAPGIRHGGRRLEHPQGHL